MLIRRNVGMPDACYSVKLYDCGLDNISNQHLTGFILAVAESHEFFSPACEVQRQCSYELVICSHPLPLQNTTRPLAMVNEDIKAECESASRGFAGSVFSQKADWARSGPWQQHMLWEDSGRRRHTKAELSRAKRREAPWQSAAALALSPHVSHTAGDGARPPDRRRGPQKADCGSAVNLQSAYPLLSFPSSGGRDRYTAWDETMGWQRSIKKALEWKRRQQVSLENTASRHVIWK